MALRYAEHVALGWYSGTGAQEILPSWSILKESFSNRAHLTRYHGVFAPNFKHRRRIIPNPVHHSAREPHASRPASMSWMQRLERVFRIDIEHCGVCGGTLRVIACIETPEVINKILAHLAAPNTGGIDHHPRAPPLRTSAAELPASPSPTLS